MKIAENIAKIKEKISSNVTILLAVKGRTKEEVAEAIKAGATCLGGNYVQETEILHKSLGNSATKAKWHIIGHLQKNKINKVLAFADVIQTIDSLELAQEINKRVSKQISIYIEVNSADENNKSGVSLYEAEELAKNISKLDNLRLEGLMTMGPASRDPDKLRTCFRRTKHLFDDIKSLGLPNSDMKTLSMGMSDSYEIAVQEGSNMIRLGTAVFGQRC